VVEGGDSCSREKRERARQVNYLGIFGGTDTFGGTRKKTAENYLSCGGTNTFGGKRKKIQRKLP
jgi:hypothetical protein